MATFLSSALVLALLQGRPGPVAGADSLAPLRARVAQDPRDADAWFQFGLGLIRLAADYHRRTGASETAATRATLDTADLAFTRAAALEPSTARADSARAFRVFAWGERAVLAWELEGSDAGARTFGMLPPGARLTPVLEELGENLLRACPRGGVLFTADPSNTYAALYLRFARRLRPDITVIPYAMWIADSALRRRVAAELRLGRAPPRRARGVPWIEVVSLRRPVCASMGFARPPDDGSRVRWSTRPLVWVTGSGASRDPVPTQDFVFAALQLAIQAHDPWARPAVALYRRAVTLSPALCTAVATYGVGRDVGCRR
jgi:hypothetical protein